MSAAQRSIDPLVKKMWLCGRGLCVWISSHRRGLGRSSVVCVVDNPSTTLYQVTPNLAPDDRVRVRSEGVGKV